MCSKGGSSQIAHLKNSQEQSKTKSSVNTRHEFRNLRIIYEYF